MLSTEMGESETARVAGRGVSAGAARRFSRGGSWAAVRLRLVHAVVLLSIAAASALSLFGLALALWTLEARADRNATWSERHRTYGFKPDSARGHAFQRVVGVARVAIPEDATYSILVGPSWAAIRDEHWAQTLEMEFLRYFLLPRRESGPEAGVARWVFCFACDRAALGSGFTVLAASGDGLAFGETRE